MRCAVWFFCCPQKMHMLFQSCLGMMPLSTVSCSRCTLVPLWGVFKWNSPYVSSPFYWSIASSSGRSSSSYASNLFTIRLILFSLSEYLPLHFIFWRSWRCSLFWRFFLNIFNLTFCSARSCFVFCVFLLCYCCCFGFILFIEYLKRWSYWRIFLISSKGFS